jgi:hypothetical protein
MAISSQTTFVSYTGNASTVTPYPVTFRYDEAAWVTVEEIEADGTITPLSLGTDFTLGGNGSTTTGTVTTTGRAIPGTSTLRISRDTALTQTVSLAVNGVLPSSVIEAEFDKITMAQLDQKRRQSAGDARSLRLPDGELAAPLPAASLRAGEVLFFNASTGAVETKTPDEILALSGGGLDLTIGTVTTGAAGSSASASISGTAPAKVLDLVIPRGDPGGPFILASAYGFSPSATATANVTALQTALNAANTAGGGTVVIDQAGDYLVNATSRIYSNTALICAPGVALSKSGSNFGEVIANDGAYTGHTDENISIIGLRIKCNGNQQVEAITSGLRGHIALWHARNVLLDNVQILDLPNAQFGIHISDWADLIVDRCRLEGTKDGLHLGKGQRGIVRRMFTDTTDDGLAINAHDYISSNPDIGEITDLTVEDCHFQGQAIRMMTGSWADWTTSTTYYRGETVRHAGKIYRAFFGAGGSGTSSVAPTHSSGTVTGADGIPWRFERVGTETETNIRRVRILNCTFRFNMIFTDAWNGATDHRAVTPGTGGNSYIEDLIIEGSEFAPPTTGTAISGYCRIKELVFRNCRFGPNCNFPVGMSPDPIPGWAEPRESLVIWDGCILEATSAALLSEAKADQLWVHDIRRCSAPNDSDGAVGTNGRLRSNDSLVITNSSAGILSPQPGDRTLIQGFQGQQVYRFGVWEPAEATPLHMLRRPVSPLTTEHSATTGSAVTLYPGHAVYMTPGTVATGYTMALFASYLNYAPGAGTSFSAPMILSGTITGQVHTNVIGRVLVGTSNYLGEYPGNLAARFTAPLVNRSFGLEVRNNGGNQEIRIIAHGASAAATPSDWFVLGTLNGSRMLQFRLHSLGNGVVHLYAASSITGRPVNLPNTPVCILASGGPTGNGAAGDNQIVAIMAADGTNAPTNSAWTVDNLTLQLVP